MVRGVLAGGLTGLVVGGTALTVLSVTSDLPPGNEPPVDPQVSAPVESVPSEVVSDIPQDVAEPSTGDAVASDVPQVAVPEVTLTAPVADTTSAAIPETGDAGTLSDAPTEPKAPEVSVDSVDPVLPNPQSIAPQIPVAEQDIAVSTQPAAPPVPDATPDVADQPVEVETATPDAQDEQPVTGPDNEGTTDPSEESAAASETAEDTSSPAPSVLETPADPSGSDNTPQDTRTDTTTPPVAEAEPEADTNEDTAVISIVPEAGTSSLPGGTTGVAIRRPTTEVAPETEEAPTTPEVDPNAPAIEKFAAEFDNSENKPVVSVTLIDDGSLDASVGAVASIGFPVTVVIDADMPDAASKMADYRAAGVEVAVRAAFPENATPSDVETAFEASFSKLPETVLLLDAGENGLRNNRAVTEFAMESLAQEGRGFLTISSGLNTALRLADQNGVPAAAIYRDLDSKDQDASVIRRFLDQAAFRARQDGQVFLLGRVRPDTISALILWGSSNRAEQIALAPASAALQSTDQ